MRNYISKDTILKEMDELGSSVSLCIKRVNGIKQDIITVHPQSLSKMALDNNLILSQARLRLSTRQLLSWQKENLDNLINYDLIPQSHIEQFKSNLSFMESVLSTESLEALCDLVIRKGDRWDENP